MCSVSYIADDWSARRLPQIAPGITYPPVAQPQVTRAEFEALRAEMAALRELLLAAKKYDEATGQPDCEAEDKVALIRRLAKLVGVDFSEVFPDADAD